MHEVVIYHDSSDSTKLSYLVQEVDIITSELEVLRSTSNNTAMNAIALLDKYIDEQLVNGDNATFTHFRGWLEEMAQQHHS